MKEKGSFTVSATNNDDTLVFEKSMEISNIHQANSSIINLQIQN